MWWRSSSSASAGSCVALVPGGLALQDLPAHGALVDPVEVDLVDHQRPARPHQLREVGDRLGERLDVVQRDDRHRGVVGAGRRLEVEQRDRLDARRLALRVDRGDVVAQVAQRRGELPVARADLEHPGGRLGQRGPDEDQHVDGERPVLHGEQPSEARLKRR